MANAIKYINDRVNAFQQVSYEIYETIAARVNREFAEAEQEGPEEEVEFDPTLCDAILNAPTPKFPPAITQLMGIHEAALMNFYELACHHIRYNPNCVNSLNQGGWTPLMYAAQNGSYDVYELLLTWGARTDIRNPKGQTAIDLAREWGHME